MEWTEVEWQGLGREGSIGCQRLRRMGSRATPLARLWGGWAWGCDEFTVGPGECDTHGEVLCEEDGSGGCLPGGPRAGQPCTGPSRPQARGGHLQGARTILHILSFTAESIIKQAWIHFQHLHL